MYGIPKQPGGCRIDFVHQTLQCEHTHIYSVKIGCYLTVNVLSYLHSFCFRIQLHCTVFILQLQQQLFSCFGVDVILAQ